MEFRESAAFATAVDLMTRAGNIHNFAKGDLLVQEGARCENFYVILSGSVKVFSKNKHGREIIYNILSTDEFFGEMLLDGGTRSASIQALENCSCVILNIEEIRRLISLESKVSEFIILTLIQRGRRLTNKAKSLALDNVYTRATTLITSEAFQDGAIMRVPPTLTQQEIANRVGASREMISFILRDLVVGGYLKKDARLGMILLKSPPDRW